MWEVEFGREGFKAVSKVSPESVKGWMLLSSERISKCGFTAALGFVYTVTVCSTAYVPADSHHHLLLADMSLLIDPYSHGMSLMAS